MNECPRTVKIFYTAIFTDLIHNLDTKDPALKGCLRNFRANLNGENGAAPDKFVVFPTEPFGP
jgi:hypothetical protein